MSVALHRYRQLRDAPDDNSRAKAIADAFEQVEERYPNLKEVATQGQLRETELRLVQEIEHTRLQIKEVEANLNKEIEQVRLEIRQVDANLRKEIEQVRLEIKEVEVKLFQSEVRLTQAIHRQTYWIIGSVGTVIGFIRLLDWLLANIPK